MNTLYGCAMQYVGLPLMLAPTRSQATRLARVLRKRQRLPIAQLRNLQLQKLRKLVQLASSQSPFYRDRFLKLGLSVNDLTCLEDIQHFPTTSKADLESHFPDGIVVEAQRNDDWQYVGTRGTTRRVMVVHDFDRRDLGRASDMVALTEDSPYNYGARQVSIPPDACSVHCGTESNRAPTVTRQLLGLMTRRIPWSRENVSDLRGLVMDTWVCKNLVLPPLSPNVTDEELKTCVASLREQRPLQLMALPEYLRRLADYIHRTGDQPPPIAVIRPMGANFPACWKSDIEAALRGNLREHYGSREMGAIAFDCAAANGLHLLMDQHLVEVIRNGKPARPGEIGKVLITDLNNLAMPIIRYDIGDLARVEYGTCPCGRTTPRLFMSGRVEDALVTHSGRVLTAEAMANFFADEPDVFDFELTEKTNEKLVLRLVAKRNHHIDTEAVRQRFLHWLGEDRPFSLRTTTHIRPESSGKYRHSKSCSHESNDSPLSLSRC